MITIIDYDAGNMLSVKKAFEHLGEDVRISRDKSEIMTSERLVLPGVGAFYDCMEKLRHYELVDVVKEYCKTGKPFLGICLGMQLLFDHSEETIGTDLERVDGLSILPGSIKLLPKTEGLKIPHMGWNSIYKPNRSRILDGIDEGSFVYFVHSYYVHAEDPAIVAAKTDYCVPIDAAVERGNVIGCQFHPEKSGDVGLAILKNFCRLKGGENAY